MFCIHSFDQEPWYSYQGKLLEPDTDHDTLTDDITDPGNTISFTIVKGEAEVIYEVHPHENRRSFYFTCGESTSTKMRIRFSKPQGRIELEMTAKATCEYSKIIINYYNELNEEGTWNKDHLVESCQCTSPLWYIYDCIADDTKSVKEITISSMAVENRVVSLCWGPSRYFLLRPFPSWVRGLASDLAEFFLSLIKNLKSKE